MTKILSRCLFILLVISMTSCLKDETDESKTIWSSTDPLDIPLKRRQNEFAEQNKVFNPSFENGRLFRDDLNTFEINGWSVIGEVGGEVEWVDTNSGRYKFNDIHSGRHAIKITNKQINETEKQGVGVISDFIKVIPGNYELTYHIKVKDICSYRNRFGNRLMDAINIRVYFYDKNKIQVSGEMINPENGRKFDNEFKAFQFSGFWHIDSLGWSMAKGISHKFPFFDGDIPDEARYVRLFFGLKGTGTMWLDDVSYHYTQHNFSLLERLQHFKDKDFKPYELIIPKPQSIEPGKEIALFDKNKPGNKPVIVLPEQSDKITRHAAKSLQDKLQSIIKPKAQERIPSIPIITNINEDQFKDYSVIFSIGKNKLNEHYSEFLPYDSILGHPEGYFIHRLHDTTNVIAISANKSHGNLYAVNTMNQLFSDDERLYHSANVIDYPDFKKRGVYVSPSDSLFNKTLSDVVDLRFNNLFYNANQTKSFSQFREQITRFNTLNIKSGISEKGISINPYLPPFMEKERQKANINSVDQISKYIQLAKQYDFQNLIIRMDSTLGFDNQCKCSFSFKQETHDDDGYNSLDDLHTTFMNSITRLSSDATTVYFMPVWYRTDCIITSNGRGELYLQEISKKISEKVHFMWTGATETPLITDEIEVYRVNKLMDENPVFFIKDLNPFSTDAENDLFKQHAPGKLRMGSIFENFELSLPENFQNLTQSTLIAETYASNAFDQIKLATLANYMWNSDDYDPDYSLLTVLISYFDKEKAFALIEFNELYQGIYEMCVKIKTEGKKKKYIRTIEEFLTRMNNLLTNFDDFFINPKIKHELKLRKTKVEDLYDRVVH